MKRLLLLITIALSVVILAISLLMVGCHDRFSQNYIQIDVADAIENGKIVNIDNYVNNIQYIQLQTDSQCLIGNYISQIILEDGKIYLHDESEICKVFDAHTGTFIRKIGRQGKGPGELTYLNSIDLMPRGGTIYLKHHCMMKYDTNGTFIKQIDLPQVVGGYHTGMNATQCDTNCFIAGVEGGDVFRYKAIFFDTNSKIIRLIPNDEKKYTQQGGYTGTSMHERPHIYHFKNKTRFYRSMEDTLFTVDLQSISLKPTFIFNFGKYAVPSDPLQRRKKGKNMIFISDLCESDQYLFLNFYFGNYAPEAFEYKRTFSDGQQIDWLNSQVYGIFNKKTGEFTLLNQPLPQKMGLKNNNGPVFWPKYISSKEEMIDYYQSYEFLEYYKHVQAPSRKLQDLVQQIKENDNPIIAISIIKK